MCKSVQERLDDIRAKRHYTNELFDKFIKYVGPAIGGEDTYMCIVYIINFRDKVNKEFDDEVKEIIEKYYDVQSPDYKVKDKIEEFPIVKAYRIMFKTKTNRLFSLKIYKTQEEALKALKVYTTENGSQVISGRIVAEYMRKDEWDKIK